MADMSAEASAKTLWMGKAQHLKRWLHAKAGLTCSCKAYKAQIAYVPRDLSTLSHSTIRVGAAGDLSYWMDESFIYSLFVGMRLLHHVWCRWLALSSGCRRAAIPGYASPRRNASIHLNATRMQS